MPTIPLFSLSLSISHFYSQGHVLTEAEAETLNQIFYSRATIEASKLAKTLGITEASNPSPVQVAFLEEQLAKWASTFIMDYRPIRALLTPEYREAQSMAKKVIFETLNAKGVDPNLIPQTELAIYIDRYIGANPGLLEAAAARLQSKRAMAQAALGGEE